MAERITANSKKPVSIKENLISHKRKTDFQSDSSTVNQILYLQRTIGNQAVQRMVRSGTLQTKLRIGQPGDKYEQEADRVADAVMRMPEPRVQRQTEEEDEEEEEMLQAKSLANQITPLVQVQRQEEPEDEEEMLQAKPLAGQITPLVQRQVEPEEEEELQAKATSGNLSEVTPNLESNILSLRRGGQPLSESARDHFEPRFGQDFSQVRVHTDAQAAESARTVNAKAYTVGQDMVFSAGQYAPETSEGRRLMAHELTHVVQQMQGRVKPTIQIKGVSINNDAGLEREAYVMGIKALQITRIDQATTGSAHQDVRLLQREGNNKGKASTSTSGEELAWEIFKPTIVGGIRSLGPNVLKATKIGSHYKEVIEVVDKLEDSISKIREYDKKIKDLNKEVNAERKFALQSMRKVNAHMLSIPDALKLDGEKLINEAAEVVNSSIFTNLAGAVTKLETFAAIVEETKKLHSPYLRMISKLTEARMRTNASFKALGVLEDALMDMAQYAVLPVYAAWAFSTARTVAGYKSDVATIRSTINYKKNGYEQSIKASEAMEAYLSGKAGRKSLAEGYRDPKSPECLDRVQAALPAVKKDPDAIYSHIFPYSECNFETVMDSLDFLLIEDSDGFFAITEPLKGAFNNSVKAIEDKQNRYLAGLELALKLDAERPTLETIESKLDPLVMSFIFQEYYRFWREDKRPLLSHYRFTYIHAIEQMTKNVGMLAGASVSYHYLSSK